MARKTTLADLEEREAAARKHLKAVQARRAAVERWEKQQRWIIAGQVVEELGLPMEYDALRARLQVFLRLAPSPGGDGANSSSHGDIFGIPSLIAEEETP